MQYRGGTYFIPFIHWAGNGRILRSWIEDTRITGLDPTICTSLFGCNTHRSTVKCLLVVTAAQSRSFAYVGTSSWNHLPLELRLELLRIHLPLLWKRLKIFSFVSDSTDLGWERLWISLKVALYKCTLTSQLILLLRNSFPEVITTGQTCKHTILNQVSYRKTTVSHP